jgi:N-acetylglucosaminyldiphosphoundecaprenol N-acetyl-beta-D-mannosaminyltransferase
MNPLERSGPPKGGGEKETPVPGVSLRVLPGPGSSSPVDAQAAPTTLFLFGVPFHDVTEDETLAWITARARSGRPSQVVTANLDFILQAWRDPEMQRIHLEADLVVADGMPPVWFSRFFGPRLRARVAGSDLVPRLGAAARDQGLSLYALGGMPGVGERAMRILQERAPGLRVAGCASPPHSPLLGMNHEESRRALCEAQPDILLVAFGAPKQEKWIRMNALPVGVPVAMGVGGSLDFIAGAQTRAPRWIQKSGMEWFWRLARQPIRLFRRYASNLIFLAMMLSGLLLIRLSPAGRNRRPAPPDGSLLEAWGAVLVPLPPLATAEEAASFLNRQEAVAAERPFILDLSKASWLNSLELGAVARLGCASRRGGRLLILTGVSGRVSRLIRLLRLDRHMDLPDTPEALIRRLEEAGAPAAERSTRWSEKGGVLEIVLPEQFERGEAWGGAEEFARRSAAGGIRSVVVDGRRLRYLDSSGLRFLKRAWQAMKERAGGTMVLRSFPEPMLEVVRGQGLDFIPVETPSPR